MKSKRRISLRFSLNFCWNWLAIIWKVYEGQGNMNGIWVFGKILFLFRINGDFMTKIHEKNLFLRLVSFTERRQVHWTVCVMKSKHKLLVLVSGKVIYQTALMLHKNQISWKHLQTDVSYCHIPAGDRSKLVHLFIKSAICWFFVSRQMQIKGTDVCIINNFFESICTRIQLKSSFQSAYLLQVRQFRSHSFNNPRMYVYALYEANFTSFLYNIIGYESIALFGPTKCSLKRMELLQVITVYITYCIHVHSYIFLLLRGYLNSSKRYTEIISNIPLLSRYPFQNRW